MQLLGGYIPLNANHICVAIGVKAGGHRHARTPLKGLLQGNKDEPATLALEQGYTPSSMWQPPVISGKQSHLKGLELNITAQNLFDKACVESLQQHQLLLSWEVAFGLRQSEFPMVVAASESQLRDNPMLETAQANSRNRQE